MVGNILQVSIPDIPLAERRIISNTAIFATKSLEHWLGKRLIQLPETKEAQRVAHQISANVASLEMQSTSQHRSRQRLVLDKPKIFLETPQSTRLSYINPEKLNLTTPTGVYARHLMRYMELMAQDGGSLPLDDYIEDNLWLIEQLLEMHSLASLKTENPN